MKQTTLLLNQSALDILMGGGAVGVQRDGLDIRISLEERPNVPTRADLKAEFFEAYTDLCAEHGFQVSGCCCVYIRDYDPVEDCLDCAE